MLEFCIPHLGDSEYIKLIFVDELCWAQVSVAGFDHTLSNFYVSASCHHALAVYS